MSDRSIADTVRLILISPEGLEALISGDLDQASAIVGHRVPIEWLDARERWENRRDTIRANPEAAPWLVHAVIGQPAGAIVGHIGFHNEPDSRGMVEVGYGTLPEYRRLGYARLALLSLIGYATSKGAIIMRASILAHNHASLATIRGLGFTKIGEYENGIDGLEFIYERPLSNGTE